MDHLFFDPWKTAPPISGKSPAQKGKREPLRRNGWFLQQPVPVPSQTECRRGAGQSLQRLMRESQAGPAISTIGEEKPATTARSTHSPGAPTDFHHLAPRHEPKKQ